MNTMPPPLSLPAKPRILVVSLRRLGDVLLTTPLIRSMRRAWPDAAIDVLVFAGTAGIVEGNPDIDRVIAMPARRGAGETLALIGTAVASDTISRFRPRPATARHCLRCSRAAGTSA